MKRGWTRVCLSDGGFIEGTCQETFALRAESRCDTALISWEGVSHSKKFNFFGPTETEARPLTRKSAGLPIGRATHRRNRRKVAHLSPDGFMQPSSPRESDDLNEKTLHHLQAAAYTFLPVSQSLSSHLGSSLLSSAVDNDINLPTSYTDTRLCPQCGTLYLPGVTCTVRTVQSRRQKRTSKRATWLIYDCAVCEKSFRMEATVPQGRPSIFTQPHSVTQVNPAEKTIDKADISDKAGKRRKRGRLHGLRDAIEKAKVEKESAAQLDLHDLMKVD